MQQIQKQQNQPVIKVGLRRKFVRGLTEWKLIDQIVNFIVAEDNGNNIELSSIRIDRESACDGLITIVKTIGIPPTSPKPNENTKSSTNSGESDKSLYGEDSIIMTIGKKEIIKKLLDCAATESYGVASSRALLNTFELATASKRRKKQSTDPTAGPAIQPNDGKATVAAKMNNKNRLISWGVGLSMYHSICENISTLINGITASFTDFYHHCCDAEKITEKSKIIFSSRRLNLITILAEMLEYGIQLNESDSVALLDGLNAMIIELKLSPEQQKIPVDTSNIWAYLFNLLFLFPENDLYHIQFYRIFLAALKLNYEPSLRMLIQKSKFVTKAIGICKKKENDSIETSRTLYGALLKCLNAMKLNCQCLHSKAFLRHYLDSHDVWKGFEEELIV